MKDINLSKNHKDLKIFKMGIFMILYDRVVGLLIAFHELHDFSFRGPLIFANN